MNDESVSLEELYDYLKQFHLSESLYYIGAVNAALKYGYAKYYTENIPPFIVKWLDEFGDKAVSNKALFLQLSRLARFLLLSGSNDYRSYPVLFASDDFQKAYNLLGRLHDTDVEIEMTSPLAVSRVFGRLAQWQFPLQGDRLPVIGRGFLLYIELPKKLNIQYNLEEKMRAYFGIGAFEFMATGMALWLTTNGILDIELKNEVDDLQGIVTPQTIKRFVELSSGTPQDYKFLVRGENWKDANKLLDIYGLDPLLKIPAIKVSRSTKLRNDSYIIPQAKYLLDRAIHGIFFLLADKEREIAESNGNKGENPFRKDFGDIYREYCGIQLQQVKQPLVFVDLDKDLHAVDQIKRPDFAIINGGTCILFEIKTSLLRVETRTLFDEEKLFSEVRSGSFKKAITQLHSFRESILDRRISDQRFQNVERVINILIGYEDIFVLNAMLLPVIKEVYNEAGNDLQLGGISDIDSIGNALNEGIDIAEFFSTKVDNEESSWSILTILEKKTGKENELIRNSFKEFMRLLGSKQP